MNYTKLWINSMPGRSTLAMDSKVFNNMLEVLPLKELRRLRKNEDLISRVAEISKMSFSDVCGCLREEYGMEITDCMNGDFWVDADDSVEKFLPKWVKEGQIPNSGWYLEADKDLLDWGRNLLMQEVRINVLIRYMEHKSARKPIEINAAISQHTVGGNYV